MATASPEAVRALTYSHRQAQARRALVVAALVAAYYRQRVDVQDPQSVERWLEIMIPRILRSHDESARLAAAYGDALRRLELPEVDDGFRFEPSRTVTEEQIRRSLSVVGPGSYLDKMTQISDVTTRTVAEPREDDRVELVPRIDEDARTAMLEDAKGVTAAKIAGATMRHVQNGGRATIHDNVKRDRVALGWIRVTRDEPCYFCAMLASRGIEYNAYSKGSFDRSDPRFFGSGTAKVHDNCQCHIKPVYTEDDALVGRAEEFEAMWREWSTGSSAQAILTFRRGYEGRIRED